MSAGVHTHAHTCVSASACTHTCTCVCMYTRACGLCASVCTHVCACGVCVACTCTRVCGGDQGSGRTWLGSRTKRPRVHGMPRARPHLAAGGATTSLRPHLPPAPQAPGRCRDPGRPSAVPSPGVGAFPGVSGVSLSPTTPASESEPVAVVSGGTVAPRPGTAQSSRCPSPASVQRALEDSRGGRLEPGAAQPSVGLWLRSHCGAETCDRFGQGGGSVGVQSQLGTHLPCDPAASVVSGEGDSRGP